MHVPPEELIILPPRDTLLPQDVSANTHFAPLPLPAFTLSQSHTEAAAVRLSLHL